MILLNRALTSDAKVILKAFVCKKIGGNVCH